MDPSRYKHANHEAAWADWLREDSWQAAAQPPASPVITSQPTTPAATKVPATVQIDIRMPKLAVPRMAVPRLPLLAVPYKKLAIAGASVATVLVVAVAGQHLLSRNPTGLTATAKPARSNATTAGARVARAEPSFTPVAPQSQPQLAQGASDVTSYDGYHDSYSYSDTLMGSSFTVSQQAIPSKYGSAQAAVERAAKVYGAKTALATKYGTAYMLTDAKTNAQVIIFATSQSLVIIQSPFTHSNEAWISYIFQLQ